MLANTTRTTKLGLKTIFNSISESVLLTDRDGIIILFNDKTKEVVFSNVGKELKVGESIFSYIEKSRLPFFKEIVSKVLNGEVVQYENEYKRISGKNVWFQFSFNPVYDNELIAGICLTGRDITNNKKYEEQRIFNERNKDALINSTNDLIWSINKDFKLITANSNYISTIKSLSSVTPKSGDDILMPGSFPNSTIVFWKELYTKALAGNTFMQDIYYPEQKKDEVWAEITFNPIYENNMVEGVSCCSRNITKKKLEEEELKESKEHFAEAERLAKLGIWNFDFKTDRLTWSDGLYNVFGTDKQTFNETHSSFVDLIDEDDRKKVIKISKRTQKTGQPFTIEYNITTPTNEKRVIEEHGYGKLDDNKKVISLFGTAQDISERKNAENKLMDANEELRILTGYLHKIREDERKRIAREIHDELGQQLTAIKMDISWLNKKLNVNEAAHKQKLSDMIGLIDTTITTVRKIASELRPAVLDDLGLAEALKWQLNDFTKHYGIQVHFNTNVEDVKFSSDITTAVFRIFQESLTNIARHANATLVICELQKSDERLLLFIKDNGIGFNAGKIAKVKSLGLLGMKERVYLLHGEFKIKSEIKKGTVVSVSIPLH